MNMAQEHYLPAQATAIKTEIQTGHTFARIALDSDDPDKTARNTAYAQKAYETARGWAERMLLSPADAKEIGEQLERLKTELTQLANKHTARS
jgi:hypothetical protein